MHKTLLHFIARNDAKPLLLEKLIATADELGSLDNKTRSTVLEAHSSDPMRGTGLMQRLPAAYDASLEVLSANDADLADSLKEVLTGNDLARHSHVDLCAALVGKNKAFVACDPMPIRYQYCMRRRADYTDEDYLAYYEQHHVKFGLQMPGIEGYSQFHIDPVASEALANALGYGVHGVSSVSELHIADLNVFFDAVAKGSDAGNAGEDEDKFVDRARSIMWLSDEVHRCHR